MTDLSNLSPEEMAELQKQNCIFCKIISGEVPGKKIYEDDLITALLDIRPAAKGHILVMPKEHYPILPVIPQDVTDHMFKVTKDLCSGLRANLPTMGTTVFIANGAAAGQQSPHFLYHIIPREGNDGLFEIPKNEINHDDVKLKIKAKLGAFVNNYKSKSGLEETNDLTKLLESNPQLKELIIHHPEKIREAMESNPQLKQVFEGIDIDALSEKLKGAPEEPQQKTPEHQEEDIVQEEVPEVPMPEPVIEEPGFTQPEETILEAEPVNDEDREDTFVDDGSVLHDALVKQLTAEHYPQSEENSEPESGAENAENEENDSKENPDLDKISRLFK